ncbi:hypothetical protein BCU96_05545 [Vibrio lentus]|uniref:hypothetical protein n=1 Tax=Vibrio lentus TaxID=136468 RepID=UPI000CB90132|nr:hypothetical protein [Vibrio lentus]PMG24934.1 hypothetical protein BCU96_05545 [Vibrio lentus]
MIDLIKIWLTSKSWFWKSKAKYARVDFLLERTLYNQRTSFTKAKSSTQVLGSITTVGLKSLGGVILTLAFLALFENHIRASTTFLEPLSKDQIDFNIDQLRLYAQLLTTIFSIYFASIGIILSTGYTKLRRDIIQLLTAEQVGNVYSRVLVFSAIFCLTATTLESYGIALGVSVYTLGTFLTAISSLALFPLGQRLFNFFNLNQLASSEVLPRIAHHIENAAKFNNSVSLSNHHSKQARLAFKQLCYIDDQMKGETKKLNDNLPALSNNYSVLLQHYLHNKHRIDHQSYWFPRRRKHKQWFFAGDSATNFALQTSSQLATEDEADYQWLENEIIDRLAKHVELAFKAKDFRLGLDLLSHMSSRISTYSEQFHFTIGMQEIQRMQAVIEAAFASLKDVENDHDELVLLIGIADTWSAFGSNLCIETMRRIITFEKELKYFFDADIWTSKSLKNLPSFLQVELNVAVERINFEISVEGQRLSKPKYVQQLAIQKLLNHYAKVLQDVSNYYAFTIPNFIRKLTEIHMKEAATQVLLASLHNHWKLPRWFDDISQLVNRYREFEHYPEKQYVFPDISFDCMRKQHATSRDEAIAMLGEASIVGHIFIQKENDELPDHFGHIYFELAEACIDALEQNDEQKLSKSIPMYMLLAFMASDSKFLDPELDINDEFRLHLISTVLNDIMSVLGFAILYGAYFDNSRLSKMALGEFDKWLSKMPTKKPYLERMVRLSDSSSFSFSPLPRDMIRFNWKSAFEHRTREDGYGEQRGIGRGKAHRNKVIRAFLRDSFSDASHLFIALHILPQLGSVDFKIDHHISSLKRSLEATEDKEEGGL